MLDRVSQERYGIENECNSKNEMYLFECFSVGNEKYVCVMK